MKKLLAIALAVVMVAGLGVFALDYAVPEFATQMTSRFNVIEDSVDGDSFSMISEDGELVIHVNDDVIIYFGEALRISDECDEVSQMVRDLLFDRTLAEVLDGRNMIVTYGITTMSIPAQTTPISIQVLFEGIVALPSAIEISAELIETEDGYENIMTLPEYIGDLDWDFMAAAELNGEIVVNGEIIYAVAPFWNEDEVLMLPLRAVAEALGYDVQWNDETQSIMLGVAINVFIGRAEAYRGRMAPVELSAAPVIVDNLTFVPVDFFRDVVAQTVFVFEGQVVIAEESDMF